VWQPLSAHLIHIAALFQLFKANCSMVPMVGDCLYISYLQQHLLADLWCTLHFVVTVHPAAAVIAVAVHPAAAVIAVAVHPAAAVIANLIGNMMMMMMMSSSDCCIG
jgi:hypothetical protein